MKTENGQIAWLSANTQRVFLDYEDALEDAKLYYFYKYEDNKTLGAYYDVYLVHLWLNEKKQKPSQKKKRK